MEVFYLKINRADSASQMNITCRYLSLWLNIANQFPDAKIYIICDKPHLTEYVKAAINLGSLDCQFISSSRNSEDLKYIMDNAIIENWKPAGYAHLTTFLHARDMGYKDFWNIDADDLGLYAEPSRIAQLLKTCKEYSVAHKIQMISLDVWASLTKAAAWSFGVTYTDNSVNWIKLMKKHCTDSDFKYLFGSIKFGNNADWFCTYLKFINAAKIESFYVENLRFIHHSDDSYVSPSLGLRYGKDYKYYFPLVVNDYGLNEAGIFDISESTIKFDISITAEESMRYLQKLGSVYNPFFTRIFSHHSGRDIPISVIFNFNSNNTPPFEGRDKLQNHSYQCSSESNFFRFSTDCF